MGASAALPRQSTAIIPLGDILRLPAPQLLTGDVPPADIDLRQRPPIAILSDALDADPAAHHRLQAALAGLPVTGNAYPALSATMDLWRVDAEEADAFAVNAEGIAVCHCDGGGEEDGGDHYRSHPASWTNLTGIFGRDLISFANDF